jgi:4-diphosphocytidyl-2-C-methyl-D-erythritol kinase
MIAFPNAKINLGLNVLEKRTDGFHNIETVFYPIDLADVLEIIPARDGVFSFTSTGLSIPGERENNLCLKAFHLLSSIFHLPPVKIHLHKVIPIGAGLGGGSSDGAYTIKLLNSLFLLGLSNGQMMDYARILGSDCAFFIENKPLFAYEKGDRFKPVSIDFSSYRIEVISPEININTAEAYAMIDLREKTQGIHSPLVEIITKPVTEWKNQLINDFEEPVIKKYPELGIPKQDLYNKGALYVSMSGSGSSFFGIFQH